jgi:hypothetical protein
MTTLFAFLLGGCAWLLAGSRLSLDAEDHQRNDILNLIGYIAAALPLAFVLVFFALGGS